MVTARFIVEQMPSVALIWFVLAGVQVRSEEVSWAKVRQTAEQGKIAQAVEWTNGLLAAEPGNLQYLYARGRWNFQLGNIPPSQKDFDELLRRAPEWTNRLWERGITCYYSGQFVEGAQQFERYQEYSSNDVENSVWRFVCQAKVEGVDKARKGLLPIAADRRVPMMQVYRLFRGEAEPAEVLKAVESAKSEAGIDREHAFMAYLYLGLYYDSHGSLDLAKKYIDLAVDQYADPQDDAAPVEMPEGASADEAASAEGREPRSDRKPPGHYMWAVARQHQRHLAKPISR